MAIFMGCLITSNGVFGYISWFYGVLITLNGFLMTLPLYLSAVMYY